MKQRFKIDGLRPIALFAIGAMFTGCNWTSSFKPMFTGETPQLDAKFGDAVRAARAAQTLDPQASARNAGQLPTMDAESAVNSVHTLRETYKTPPPTFSIFGAPVQAR
jgi:hypothetical protein